MTRKFIAAVLLASTVASPLLAQDHDRWQHGEQGGHLRGDRPAAQPQQPPQGAPQQAPQQRVQPQQQRDWRGGGGDWRGDGGRGFERRPDQGQARPPVVPPLGQPQQQRPDQRWGGNGDGRRDPRPGDFSGRSPFDQRSPYEHAPGDRRDDGRRDNQQWQRSDRNDRRPVYSADRDRNGGASWDQNRERRWDNGWRSDRRYDWRGYRDSNHALFRGPRYAAPRDWSYRRFAPGYRIAPFLFAQQYWIDDPWQYRLPPAYGPYRWVRYYDDVLLIDIRSGIVVDAIPNFFF